MLSNALTVAVNCRAGDGHVKAAPGVLHTRLGHHSLDRTQGGTVTDGSWVGTAEQHSNYRCGQRQCRRQCFHEYRWNCNRLSRTFGGGLSAFVRKVDAIFRGPFDCVAGKGYAARFFNLLAEYVLEGQAALFRRRGRCRRVVKP